MSYSDNFSAQWDRFVSDFLKSIKGYTAEMISIERLNDWYKTNSFRWNSIAENEGILLEHENNITLKNELLKELSKFSFSAVELLPKPNALPYLSGGVLVAAGLGVALKLIFHRSFLFVAIEAVVAVLASAVIYYKKHEKNIFEQKKNIYGGDRNTHRFLKKKMLDGW